MIAEALRALYDLAQRCRVCDDHAATREGHDETRGPLVWRICDRVACEARCLCADCGRDGTSPEPIAPDGIYCLRCGTTRPPRLVPRSTAWRDLPHAAALRAANAAHEARRNRYAVAESCERANNASSLLTRDGFGAILRAWKRRTPLPPGPPTPPPSPARTSATSAMRRAA